MFSTFPHVLWTHNGRLKGTKFTKHKKHFFYFYFQKIKVSGEVIAVVRLWTADEWIYLLIMEAFLWLLMLLSCRKGGFFVDLFVRVSNQVAVNMYKRLGYSVYRTVIEYYSASNGEPDEDAYGELSYRNWDQIIWVKGWCFRQSNVSF